jgi:hypothetical protein
MANIQKSVSEKEEVYHLPAMMAVQFRVWEWQYNQSALDRIITEVSKNIPEFGYSIIVFQPHDLFQTDQSGIILDTGLLKSTGVHDL